MHHFFYHRRGGWQWQRKNFHLKQEFFYFIKHNRSNFRKIGIGCLEFLACAFLMIFILIVPAFFH